jgi:hypothetical protein
VRRHGAHGPCIRRGWSRCGRRTATGKS